MKFIWSCILLFSVIGVFGQTKVGLVAHYPFDTSLVDITGNTANNGIPIGTPALGCGPVDNAVLLDNLNDQVTFIGQVNNEFDTEDFTISLYFKSISAGGTQYLLSKRSEDCENQDQIFYIRYAPLNNNRGTINIFLQEGEDRIISIIHTYQNDACWQHLTLVRQGTKVKLYLNGEFAQELGANGRVDIMNDGNLVLGGSPCLDNNRETSFIGFIDDFRVYNRALDEEEISGLYSRPDQIGTQDTIIFLGNALDISLSNTCATAFLWNPTTGIDPIETNQAEPTITPTEGGTFVYTVQMDDNVGTCIASDSITIRVIDPNSLDCAEIFLPKAFTPNNDGLNDAYGISNPFAIQELVSFEIFDRWGNRLFFTDDPFQKWDGTYAGAEINPGTMLYRILFKCNEEEKVIVGNFAVVK